MKRVTFFLFFLLVPATSFSWQGQVVYVLDADSILIRKNNKLVEVRLYGVDAPEYKQKFSAEAKAFVMDKVAGKKVKVISKGKDRYNRVIGLLEYDGNSLNYELVKNGWAWVYDRYCRSAELCRRMDKAEETARDNRIGLWQGDNPLAPWRWRRLNRKNRKR